MSGGIGFTDLILFLAIVLIIFGAGKLPQLGEGLGKAIKPFKKRFFGDRRRSHAPVINDQFYRTVRRNRYVAGSLLLVSLCGIISMGWAQFSDSFATAVPISPWIGGGIGIGCGLAGLLMWRCPNCHESLGRITSRVCVHCGASLLSSRQTNRGHLGTIDVGLCQRKFKELFVAIDTLDEQYRRIRWPLILVSILVFAALIWHRYIWPNDLLLLALLIGAPVFGYFVGHNLAVVYYWWRLWQLWRCPACCDKLPLSLYDSDTTMTIHVCPSYGLQLQPHN